MNVFGPDFIDFNKLLFFEIVSFKLGSESESGGNFTLSKRFSCSCTIGFFGMITR